MPWLKKHAASLVVAGLCLWWLVTGDLPVVDWLTHLVGRGRQLTWPTVDADGNVIESVDQLLGQAVGTLGRPIDRDAFLLGTVSASEHATASRREKAAIQRVCMNDAAAHGWSILFTVTNNKGLGKQAGRRYASRKPLYEQDLLIAESNLAGSEPDETAGATKFVHITGFAHFGAFRELCERWYQEHRIVPVELPGIESFRIFLPESQVQNG